MKTKEIKLSKIRIDRIREQGYFNQTDGAVCDIAFGNRFAYRACVSILIVGTLFSNIPVLLIMMLIAFLGVVLPYHPFDYIYNNLLSKRLNKPKLAKRSRQAKFACGLATIWIGMTIFLFHNNLMLEGYVLGGLLIGVASLVATIDLCIPSIIYNSIFTKRAKFIQNNIN